MVDDQFMQRFDGDDGKPINKELLNFQLKAINDRLSSIDNKLENNDVRYVTRTEFLDFKKEYAFLAKIVYGGIGLVLIGFATMVINFFLKSPKL